VAAPVRQPRSWGVAILASVATVAGATAVGWFVLGQRLTEVVMTFLLGVVLMAVRFGYAASLVTTVLSVLAFDYFFTQPLFSLAITDPRQVVTFGAMLFVALVISDQTERLRRSVAAAKEHEGEVRNERLRNALLSSVSHDLRTPLAVVKGAATALIDGKLTPERRLEYLHTISEEASRLNRLVRKLLDMTSLEADTLRANKEWQPIEEVVGVALNRLEDQLEDRRVDVRIAPEAALAPFDATLVEQLLINLVENASKYSNPPSPIEINARRVPGGVEIEVADRGPGVPPGEEERIFDKFHRATRTAAGMGLGLTICRGVVTAHGGRIWSESRPGGGASFRFVLPCADAPTAMNALPEALPEA
jgi:two-component system, OmpR family, sensor histidine kinase KdpD